MVKIITEQEKKELKKKLDEIDILYLEALLRQHSTALWYSKTKATKINKVLKKISAKNHLVFLISDGKPFLSDSDISVLDEDFRQSLIFAQREKVHVFGFGFFEQLQFFLKDNFCNATNSQQLLKFCEQKLNKYN